MKKVLLIAACAVFALGANAQDEAASSSKRMWLGGSTGFASGSHSDDNDKLNDYSTTSWSFGPEFGFMLNDKMAIGLALTVKGQSASYEDTKKTEIASGGFEVNPFFRYYFAGNDKLKFFGQLNVAIGSGTRTTSVITAPVTPDKEVSYGTFGAGVNVGVQYWLKDNWSILSSIGVLGYESTVHKDGTKDANGKDQQDSDSSFGLNADFADLNFALIFHF